MHKPRMHARVVRAHTVHLWGCRWELWRQSPHEPAIVLALQVPPPGMGLGGWRDRLVRRVALKKPQARAASKSSPLKEEDTLGLKELPGLRGFFLDTLYTDGSGEREPGSMTIRGGVTSWSCTLREPSACTQVNFTARTWDEMLLLAEACCTDDNTLWEHDAWAASRRPRKKGKG